MQDENGRSQPLGGMKDPKEQAEHLLEIASEAAQAPKVSYHDQRRGLCLKKRRIIGLKRRERSGSTGRKTATKGWTEVRSIAGKAERRGRLDGQSSRLSDPPPRRGNRPEKRKPRKNKNRLYEGQNHREERWERLSLLRVGETLLLIDRAHRGRECEGNRNQRKKENNRRQKKLLSAHFSSVRLRR